MTCGPRGARPGSHTNFRASFGIPVRDMCSKLRFAPPPYTSLLAVPPFVDSGSLGEGVQVFGALAAEIVEKRPFSGAAAEKDVASEGQNAPGPAGPGAAQTHCFPMFSKNDIHPESSSLVTCKIVWRCKLRKWPLAQNRCTFSLNFVFKLCESRR